MGWRQTSSSRRRACCSQASSPRQSTSCRRRPRKEISAPPLMTHSQSLSGRWQIQPSTVPSTTPFLGQPPSRRRSSCPLYSSSPHPRRGCQLTTRTRSPPPLTPSQPPSHPMPRRLTAAHPRRSSSSTRTRDCARRSRACARARRRPARWYRQQRRWQGRTIPAWPPPPSPPIITMATRGEQSQPLQCPPATAS